MGQITDDLPKGVKPPEHFRPLVDELEVPVVPPAKTEITDPLSAASAGERVTLSEVTAGKRVK